MLTFVSQEKWSIDSRLIPFVPDTSDDRLQLVPITHYVATMTFHAYQSHHVSTANVSAMLHNIPESRRLLTGERKHMKMRIAKISTATLRRTRIFPIFFLIFPRRVYRSSHRAAGYTEFAHFGGLQWSADWRSHDHSTRIRDHYDMGNPRTDPAAAAGKIVSNVKRDALEKVSATSR